jgi:hypothetical protein
MALNENEKAKVRLLIEQKPQAEYMQQLAADDVFARAEIAGKCPTILINKQVIVEQHLAHINYVENELAKLYADIATLTNEE